MPQDVELRQLRYFLAVADELNFTRAAAQLRLDQPALSRQIRRLEHTLGVALFVRTSRRVELTPAGARLQVGARELLAREESVLAEVRSLGVSRPTRLRLGWLVPFRDQLMARLVRSFEADADATVDLVRTDFTDPSGGLAAGLVDAAIVNPPLATSGLSYLPLLRERRVVIIADTHPLARQQTVTLADLDALDLLWAVPPSDDQVWQDHWAAADMPGRRLPARRWAIAENQDYLQRVAAGQAFGLNLVGAVGDALRDYGIAAVPVSDLGPTTIALAWRTGDPNPLLPDLAAAARRLSSVLD
ncbi:LysR family transcriptional regulator [uncultured Friedmanniella sp.]|uniref:LysR family transcriptional regulator n=1 Tax=uncultured Friedmanniella sp. TaxID=335381 RepID=UPI0035CC49CF